jgi:hypothetical protein
VVHLIGKLWVDSVLRQNWQYIFKQVHIKNANVKEKEYF